MNTVNQPNTYLYYTHIRSHCLNYNFCLISSHPARLAFKLGHGVLQYRQRLTESTKNRKLSQHSTRIYRTFSGVTRIGVTRSGNWRYHPYFSWNKLTTFLVIAVCKVMTFLAVRPRFPTVLSKFSHNFFHSVVAPLNGVTRGGQSLPSDANANFKTV